MILKKAIYLYKSILYRFIYYTIECLNDGIHFNVYIIIKLL